MKKNGFTLIEIIVCLAIISLIAGISVITILSSKNDDISKEDEEEFKMAVDLISDKLESVGALNSYKNSGVESGTYTKFFCLKKETLLAEGILTGENAIITGMNDDEYVRVVMDELGSFTLDISNSDMCNYLKSELDNTDISNTEPKIVDNLDKEENGYYLSQHVIQDENATNNYKYNIDFKFNTGKLNDTSFRPDTYTVFLIDGSGSMCRKSSDSTCKKNGSMFQRAMDASKNLASQLVSVNVPSNSFRNYVSVISFDNNIDKNIDFQTTALTNSDFKFGNGGTKYSVALDAAYNKIKNFSKENNRFFVIFLTDGVPGDTSSKYTASANNIKNFLKPSGSDIEYGKLITVGFNYTDSKLISISSLNCKGEGTNCYYQANSTNIGTVFEEFFNVIKKEVMCSTFKKARVTINLSDNFEFSDGSKEKVIGNPNYIELACDTADLTSALQTQTILDNALYDLKFNQPDVESLSVGKHEFPIVDKMSIEFFDGDNNLIDTISYVEDDFPSVTLNIDKVSVIN